MVSDLTKSQLYFILLVSDIANIVFMKDGKLPGNNKSHTEYIFDTEALLLPVAESVVYTHHPPQKSQVCRTHKQTKPGLYQLGIQRYFSWLSDRLSCDWQQNVTLKKPA